MLKHSISVGKPAHVSHPTPEHALQVHSMFATIIYQFSTAVQHFQNHAITQTNSCFWVQRLSLRCLDSKDFALVISLMPQVTSEQYCELRSLAQACSMHADLRPTDIVMDLFCGTGSIGLTLAKHCQHVYGFEVAASAVADAKRNAVLNHITNATFVGWDLTKVSASMGKRYPRPDVIVTGITDFVIRSTLSCRWLCGVLHSQL